MNFKVLHPNGKEWTKGQAEKYLEEINSDVLHHWTFAVTPDNRLFIIDKFGLAEEVDYDKFKIDWNVDEKDK